MKNRAKSMLLIVLAIMLLSTLAVSTYAFFTSDIYKEISGQISGSDKETNAIEVASFSDLYKYSVGGTSFLSGTNTYIKGKDNDSENVSDVSNRLVLKFTDNITLESNISFNSDVHINLNKKTLYLDGYEFIISHTYSGNTIISNGTVVVDELLTDEEIQKGTTAKTGMIYFDAPYSKNYLDNVTFSYRDTTKEATSTDFYSDVSANTNIIAYNAIKEATKKIVNVSDTLSENLSYAEIIAMTETTFDANLFLSTKFCYAGADSTTAETCAFIFSDLDLAENVKAYSDITVEYSSSDTAVLSNLGNVTADNSGIKTVNLTITIKQGDNTIGTTVLSLHIVDTTNDSQMLVAGKSLLSAYMMRFYKNISESETAQYKYVIARSMQLPYSLTLGSGSLTFAYNGYDSEEKEVSNVFSHEDGSTIYTLEPSSAITKITATITANNSSDTMDFDVKASDAGLVRTDASFAQDFVTTNYGGKINIKATRYDNTDGTISYTFDSVTLYSPKNGNANSKIQSVKYSLVNDTNSIYTLSGDGSALSGDENITLSVASGKNPFDYVQTVQLECEFVIDGIDDPVKLQIPIYAALSDGTNVAAFLQYYNYYNQMFFTTTGCYTVEDFEMPFCSGKTTSDYVVCYDMLQYTENTDGTKTKVWNNITGVEVILYYNGTEHSLTADTNSSGYKSYVTALNGLTDKITTIVGYGDAKWIFKVTKNSLTSSNQKFEFVYNYVSLSNSNLESATDLTTLFTVFEDSSVADTPMTTEFTIPGILRNTGSGDGYVTDTNLYNVIGSIFGGDSFTKDNSYIYTDLLKQNLSIDVNDTTAVTVGGSSTTVSALLKATTNFDGLKYLVGTTYLDLSGIDLSGIDRTSTASSGEIYKTNLSAISSMSALETLVLANCNLGEVVGDIATVPPSDTALDSLTNLKNLKTLDLSNKDGVTTNENVIYNFEFLLNMQSLNTAKVYGNLDTTTIEGVFYGSEGLVNMEHFAELTDEGVAIYNTASGSVESLFTASSGTNDYRVLQNIEYQRKLTGSKSIETVYSQFTTATPKDFALNETYTVSSTTYTVSNYTSADAFTWGYEGDDATTSTRFYVEYHLQLTSGSNSVKVNIRVCFNVVRVGTATTTSTEEGA